MSSPLAAFLLACLLYKRISILLACGSTRSTSTTGPPVECDYEPKGVVSKVGELDTYFIGQYRRPNR